VLVLVLPHLVAGRDLADLMLDRLADSFQYETVVVDARRTASGSPSFASQLVQRTLADGGADCLILVGAPSRFAQHVTESASRRSVAGRLDLTPAMPAWADGVVTT